VKNGEGGATAGVEARNEESGATGDGQPSSSGKGARRTLRHERHPASLLAWAAVGSRRGRRCPEPLRRPDGIHRGRWKGGRSFGTGVLDIRRGGERRSTPEWEDDRSSAARDVGRVLRDTARGANRSGEPELPSSEGCKRYAGWIVTVSALGRTRWRFHARHGALRGDRVGRTNGRATTSAWQGARRILPGTSPAFHVSSDDRMPSRCHLFDDRFVGCRAVTAETRRQVGRWDIPLGGVIRLSSRPSVTSRIPLHRIPRIALLVLGTLEGKRTSWEDVREPFDLRRWESERTAAGSQFPEGGFKATRGNNRTELSVRVGHGREDARVPIQRA
jgi:hypothetical protein